MAKRKEIDAKALLKLIDDGAAQKEIMAQFGFKNSGQLKVAYLNALVDTGKAAGIKTSAAAKPVETIVTVNNRGSLTIPKSLVAHFELAAGDAFTVRKSKAGLSLKKIDA
jgi:hypothetical protein